MTSTERPAPALPSFYGQPIDTPSGHRWAGYTRPTTHRFNTSAGVLEAPFTVSVGESSGRPNYRTEGPFATPEEAHAIVEVHKAAGRLSSFTDAAGRPVTAWLNR